VQTEVLDEKLPAAHGVLHEVEFCSGDAYPGAHAKHALALEELENDPAGQ
jgi:hypothetical protein